MDKQIKNCTAKEIFLNLDLNKNDLNYMKAYATIQGMYDFLVEKNMLNGDYFAILNTAFDSVKSKMIPEVLETVIHVEKS